jgi:hypothetical protein
MDHRPRCAVLLAVAILTQSLGALSVDARSSFESYLLFLNDNPKHGRPAWIYGGRGTQGIGHDATNWYISTQTGLWKIPVGVDINQDAAHLSPGVMMRDLSTVGPLVADGYDHFGDVDCHRHRDRWYVLVPIQRDRSRGPRAAVAVFLGEGLAFVGHGELSAQAEGGAGWCAILGEMLVSSNNDATKWYFYRVDWDELYDHGKVAVSLKDSTDILDEQGRQLELYNMQGGEFTPSGELLYVTCGVPGCCIPPFGCGVAYPSDGMHVFDVATWRRLWRSENGSGYFNYAFDGDCFHLQEPEGLTVWDLDDGTAPGVEGGLHVILFQHNIVRDDQVWLKHYSGTLYVDDSGPSTGDERGTKELPFRSLREALSTYPIWDGARVAIRPGSYMDSVRVEARVRLTAPEGTVTIGR